MLNSVVNSVVKKQIKPYKIAIIIPCTSNGRTWANIRESYLFKLTIIFIFL